MRTGQYFSIALGIILGLTFPALEKTYGSLQAIGLLASLFVLLIVLFELTDQAYIAMVTKKP